MSAMSSDCDKPLYDTTAGKVAPDPSVDDEPAAKRIRLSGLANAPLGGSRILVVQNIGGGQQILVEQSTNETITFQTSEPGGLETLAETAAATIPASSSEGETITLVPQHIDIASANSSTADNSITDSQPSSVLRIAYNPSKSTPDTDHNAELAHSPSSLLEHGERIAEPEVRNEVEEEDEEEEIEDTHRCGKCGNEFTTLEEYIAHKLHDAKCQKKSKTVVSTSNLRVSGLSQGDIDLGVLLSPQMRGVRRGRGRGKGRGRGRGTPGRPPRQLSQNRESVSPRKAETMKYKRIAQDHSTDKLYDIALYCCPNCDKTFRREAALNRHVEYDHVKKEDDSGEEDLELDADESQDYAVGELEVADSEEDRLEDEDQMPTPVPDITNRPYQCTICQLRFKELSILRAHWLTHTDKRDFKCPWTGCVFAFKTKGSLVRHMRRHTGDRPFKCEKCGRHFGESGALTRHLKSRTPCTSKTDSDLPRYGRRSDFVLPRSMFKSKNSLEPGELPGALPHQNGGTTVPITSQQTVTQPGQSLLNSQITSMLDYRNKSQISPGDGHPLRCRVCDTILPDTDALKTHLKTHLSKSKYRCEMCTYATHKEADLALHKQVTHHIRHEMASKSEGQELVVVSDVPSGSEQMVVEQVLEQYISQGYDLNDLAEKTTATAVVNGQEVQVHIIRADSMVDQDGVVLHPEMVGSNQQVFTLRTEEISPSVDNNIKSGNEGIEGVEADPSVVEVGEVESIHGAPLDESATSVDQDGELIVPVDIAQNKIDHSTKDDNNSEALTLESNVEGTDMQVIAEHMTVEDVSTIETEKEIVASGLESLTQEDANAVVEHESIGSDGINHAISTVENSQKCENFHMVTLDDQQLVGSQPENNISDPGVDGSVSIQEAQETCEVPASEGVTPHSELTEGVESATQAAESTEVHILKPKQMPDGSVTYVIEALQDGEPSEATTVLTMSGNEMTITDKSEEQQHVIQETGNEGPEGSIEIQSSASPMAADENGDKQTRDAAVALQQLLELRDNVSTTSDDGGVSGQKSSHSCPVCNRSFRGAHYLRLHMRSHTGERPHKCQQCPKTFATRDTLSKHMVSHSADRQYKCGECGKMFKRISHVREHLRIHSVERPYPCHYCEKAFKTPNACKVHLRTHTDELPWECPHCHRLFREKGSMDRHVRIHTGVRPYKCNYCGRAFSEHGTLNRHLKAKVPCTRQLQAAREQGEFTGVAPNDVPEYTEVTEVPSLLAEFSSVVADTQQYITQTEETPQEEQAEQEEATQYVMVTEDGQQQPIKIITDGMTADGTALQNAEYVLLEDGNITVRMLDETGESCVVDLQQDMSSTPVAVVTDSGGLTQEAIHAVAMIPTGEEEEEEEEVVGNTEVVTIVHEGEQELVIQEDMIEATLEEAVEVAEVGSGEAGEK